MKYMGLSKTNHTFTTEVERDFRGLTPLLYHHGNPYWIFELNIDQRMPIKLHAA